MLWKSTISLVVFSQTYDYKDIANFFPQNFKLIENAKWMATIEISTHICMYKILEKHLTYESC